MRNTKLTILLLLTLLSVIACEEPKYYTAEPGYVVPHSTYGKRNPGGHFGKVNTEILETGILVSTKNKQEEEK